MHSGGSCLVKKPESRSPGKTSMVCPEEPETHFSSASGTGSSAWGSNSYRHGTSLLPWWEIPYEGGALHTCIASGYAKFS